MDEKKKKAELRKMSVMSRQKSSSSQKSGNVGGNIVTMRTTFDFNGKGMKGSTGSPTRATAYQTGFASVDFSGRDGAGAGYLGDVFKSRMLNEKVNSFFIFGYSSYFMDFFNILPFFFSIFLNIFLYNGYF